MTHKISFHFFSAILHHPTLSDIIISSFILVDSTTTMSRVGFSVITHRAQHSADWHQLKDIITYDSSSFAFINSTTLRQYVCAHDAEKCVRWEKRTLLFRGSKIREEGNIKRNDEATEEKDKM